MAQYRQGDVLLESVEGKMMAGAVAQPPENGRLILARGERTGHNHSVDAAKATLYRQADERWLIVAEKTDLEHQEHPSITLEPGVYEFRQQRSLSPELRPVERTRFD